MRCCRPDLVIDIFFRVDVSCKGLKSAKVLQTATRSKKKRDIIVEGQRLRTVHNMERTCFVCAHMFVSVYIKICVQIYICIYLP